MHAKGKRMYLKAAKCEAKGCHEVPCYESLDAAAPTRCYRHKQEGQVDRHRFACELCSERYVVKHLFSIEGRVLCLYCADGYDYDADRCSLAAAEALYSLHPQEFIAAPRKKRVEHVVVDKLAESMQGVYRTEDQVVEAGCSRRRPDLVIPFFGECIVVVEVDEYQHAHYDKDCEDNRMRQVRQDIACGYMDSADAPLAEGCTYVGLPVVFIRFNPHACKGPRGKDPLEVRIGKLEKEIQKARKMGRDAVVYLYYDAYKGERKGFFL